jgi:anthranilate 1,2-dioxygenase small subunit
VPHHGHHVGDVDRLGDRLAGLGRRVQQDDFQGRADLPLLDATVATAIPDAELRREHECENGADLFVSLPAASGARSFAAMPISDRTTLRLEVEDLYHDYVECLDDGDLERWPDFFTEECLYQVIPRENYDRGLPLALMLCESRNMLRDRVEALRRSSVYAPRALRHLLSNVRVKAVEGDEIRVQANYAVLQTLSDEPTTVFNAGRYLDRVVREGSRLLFREKICVFDSVLVPGSLLWPI